MGKIGNNIKEYLIFNGLSQDELAQKLYMNVNHLNEKINDKQRSFTEEELINIANVFGVSVDDLKNEEFNSSNVAQIGDAVSDTLVEKDDGDNDKMGLLIFPYEKSPKALKNESFQKAYELHIRIINEALFMDESIINECYKLYEKAHNEGIIEGLVDMLCISSIYKFVIKNIDANSNQNYDDVDKTDKKGVKKYFKQVRNNDEQKQEEAEKYISNTTTDIFDILVKLKKYSQYEDLVEYYIAVLYAFNLIDSSYDKSTNVQFAKMYIEILKKFNNKYFEHYKDAWIDNIPNL